MRRLLVKMVFISATGGTGAAMCTLPVSSSAAPAVSAVHAKYVVNGGSAGSGTVVEYGGQVYVPLGAVKALTGTQVNWDPQTATLSAGAAAVKGGAYLEDLPGQPYYESSAALCWQFSVDVTPGKVQSRVNRGAIDYPCQPTLSARPTMAAQHYGHDLVVLASATGAKAPNSDNTVTLDYDLGGHYLTLSGTVGLVDKPFNRAPMELTLVGDGKILGSSVVSAGSLPAPFKVSVAHVRELSVEVSNVSGAAPYWDNQWQYAPGAVLIADPQLAA